MANPDYPILVLSGQLCVRLDDEVALRRFVSLATDRAIKSGMLSDARIFDCSGAEYRFGRVELGPGPGFFGWLRRARDVRAMELAVVCADADLERAKKWISDSIKENEELWTSAVDPDVLVGRVNDAKDMSALIATFSKDSSVWR